ncbi:hypothetical protein D9758_015398 [Tetrapyrgos nigripes]|uniref:Uncharacterized protein n=1 Tax=Tetrapyrgos nigripes TaxID=182062 RepID=A0A8H5CEZ5_9AGAR|nr:hypothetical protein D9758_015813 [Tetrapyrgos nigripes]KAF5342891.1 hypothetical protein D9758_015398 [Tetrapyrgos nigripes]
MLFTTALFFAFALLLPAASAAAPPPSLRHSCGSDARVIEEKTFVHESKEIKLVTKSCPGFAGLRNVTASSGNAVEKRQISQCSNFCLDIACDPTDPQPVSTDCNVLTNFLIGLGETVAVPPQGVIEATSGTCFYDYANFDTIEYDVCTSGFGRSAQDAMTDCLLIAPPVGTITAAFCLPEPQEGPGNDYAIEIGHV